MSYAIETLSSTAAMLRKSSSSYRSRPEGEDLDALLLDVGTELRGASLDAEAQRLENFVDRLKEKGSLVRIGHGQRECLSAAMLLDNLARKVASTPALSVAEEEAFLSVESVGDRGYCVNLCNEMNLAVAAGLWNAAAVLARKLIELLMLDLYEALGVDDDIKTADGRFKQMSRLMADAESKKLLDHNAHKAMKEWVKLANLAAHKPRFMVKKDAIMTRKTALLVLVSELVYRRVDAE